jgi:hypothetical protein
MTDRREGNVVWTFDDDWSAIKYDDWAFYRNQFNSCADGNKAMDILALSPQSNVLWMIEAKDYRINQRNPDKEPLPMEVAKKARDTLAGLMAAAANAVDDEKAFARSALAAERLRVVLHLEQPTSPSRLFPRAFDPSDVQQKMRQLLKAIDPHPQVMATTTTNWTHWATTWAPQ